MFFVLVLGEVGFEINPADNTISSTENSYNTIEQELSKLEQSKWDIVSIDFLLLMLSSFFVLSLCLDSQLLQQLTSYVHTFEQESLKVDLSNKKSSSKK